MKLLLDSFYGQETKDISDRRIGDLLTAINTKLTNREFNFIDDLDETRLPTLICVGLLRYSFTARAHMPGWAPFRDRCHAEFIRRGLKADELLQGLFRDG